jgi:hypothetical protein
MTKRLLFAVAWLPWLLQAGAKGASAQSRDENRLVMASAQLDADAVTAEGQKTVGSELATEFRATDAQIRSLRAQKLGYGEIAVVLAMAGNLPGGPTDGNIASVLTLRQGPPAIGWGVVAYKLGFNLRPVLDRVRKAEVLARNEENRRMDEERGFVYQ